MLEGKIFEGLNKYSNLSKAKEVSKEGLRQHVIFQSESKNLYAIHVSKVEGLIILEDLEIAKNTTESSIIVGKANIRGSMVSLVDYEMWLHGKKFDEKLNELVMLCSYGGEQFGLIIRSVYGVRDFEAKSIFPASSDDTKISFITELETDKTMCNIVDADRLFFDIYPHIEEEAKNSYFDDLVSQERKKIVFAQTSLSMRKIVKNLFEKSTYQMKEVFDGYALLEYVQSHHEEIDAVVYDLDIPKKDGIEIIEILKSEKQTESIPLIIFANMANGVLENSARELGVSEVITRADVTLLAKTLSIILGETK